MPKEIKNQEKILYIIERYFKFILFIVFVFILIIGYFIVLGDKYSSYIKSKNITLVGISDSIKNLENDKRLIQNAKKANLTMEEERLIYMAIPKTFDFSSIVSQLTSLSNSYNFNVNNIEVTKAEISEEISSNQGIKSTRISLSVSGGNYEEFKRLLSAIETSSMIFDVLSVNFGSGGSYDLVIRSYYLN